MSSEPLPPGETDPACDKFTAGIVDEIDRALKGDLGDNAILLFGTGAVLYVGIISIGTADGIRWKRENGPRCRQLKQQFAELHVGDFHHLMPQTCNEYLAAVRALQCLRQVRNDLSRPFLQLKSEKVPVQLRLAPQFETCSDIDAGCRRARVMVEVGVEFEQTLDVRRERLTPV